MKRRECLDCGFICVRGEQICPKCDAVLLEQTDGSTAAIDVAHRNETVDQAAEKVREAIRKHMAGYTQYLRVVTGRGLIKETTWNQLEYLAATGRIVDFDEEPHNPGAVVVTLRA